jgi:hypothetical protein
VTERTSEARGRRGGGITRQSSPEFGETEPAKEYATSTGGETTGSEPASIDQYLQHAIAGAAVFAAGMLCAVLFAKLFR